MRKDADAGSVDATWRISSSPLRMCARQDCFVFERPQVVLLACQTKKNEPETFKKNDAFTRGVFRVGVHTHIGTLCLVTRC